MRNERGALVLGAAILLAVVCSVIAYVLLMMASADVMRSHRVAEGIRADYLAEAGMVWADQRLWRDPTFCPTNLPVNLEGRTVLVSVTNCGTARQQVITQVVY